MRLADVFTCACLRGAVADFKTHGSPDHASGSPLFDVTLNGTYPSDVYSDQGLQYYGTGNRALDALAHDLIQRYRGRANTRVTIYRAVPHTPTVAERLQWSARQKAYVLKHGRVPADWSGQLAGDPSWKQSSRYYDWLDAEQARIQARPWPDQPVKAINSGDWVTPFRRYAEEHGRSALQGDYRIVKKQVYARDIFTAGDSWLEWGYDPQPFHLEEDKGTIANGTGIWYNPATNKGAMFHDGRTSHMEWVFAHPEFFGRDATWAAALRENFHVDSFLGCQWVSIDTRCVRMRWHIGRGGSVDVTGSREDDAREALAWGIHESGVVPQRVEVEIAGPEWKERLWARRSVPHQDRSFTRPEDASRFAGIEPGDYPIAESLADAFQLDETVQELKKYLDGAHLVIDCGKIGWFSVYRVLDALPPETISKVDLKKIHTLAEFRAGSWSDDVVLNSSWRAISGRIASACNRLTGLGFQKRHEVMILVDASKRRNPITGGGVGGSAYTHALDVDPNAGNLDWFEGAVIHEWAHRFAFSLPRADRDYIKGIFQHRVVDPTVAIQEPEFKTEYISPKQALRAAHMAYEAFKREWRAVSWETYDKIRHGEKLREEKLSDLLLRNHGDTAPAILLRDVKLEQVSRDGRTKQFKAGDQVEVFRGDGKMLLQYVSKEDWTTYDKVVDFGDLDSWAKFDESLLNMEEKARLEKSRKFARQSKLTYYAGDKELTQLAADAALNHIHGEIKHMLDDEVLGLREILAPNWDERLLPDAVDAARMWRDRVRKTHRQAAFDPGKTFLDTVTYDWLYKPYGVYKVELVKPSAYSFISPEGDALRHKAEELKLVPSAYAAADPDEFWAVLVEYAAMNPAKLGKELKAVVNQIVSGIAPGKAGDVHKPRGMVDRKNRRVRESLADVFGGYSTEQGARYGYNPTTGKDEAVDKNVKFVRQVRAWGYPNPFNAREIVVGDAVSLEVHEFDGTVRLVSIRAFTPKQGAGTEVMEKLVELADQLGVTLGLDPVPYHAQVKIPQRKLIQWYRRFGFTGGAEGMERLPKSAESVEERYAGAATERGIWYHGTARENLPAILSQGLIPDPKKRVWADDPGAGFGQPSRVSYGGIYVTQNLMTARSSVPRNTDKAGGVIVVMELQPRTLLADEDDFLFSASQMYQPNLNWSPTTAAWLYLASKYGRPDDADTVRMVADAKQSYAAVFLRGNKDLLKEKYTPQLEDALKAILPGLWDAAVMRAVAYYPQAYGSQWKWNWLRDYTDYSGKPDEGDPDKIPQPPTPAQGEAAFRAAVDKATRTLKSRVRVERGTFKTARSLEPIRFSGSNRIVAIVQIERVPAEQRKEGGPYETVRVIYGKLPDDFKTQWKERVGPLVLESTTRLFADYGMWITPAGKRLICKQRMEHDRIAQQVIAKKFPEDMQAGWSYPPLFNRGYVRVVTAESELDLEFRYLTSKTRAEVDELVRLYLEEGHTVLATVVDAEGGVVEEDHFEDEIRWRRFAASRTKRVIDWSMRAPTLGGAFGR
jgi:hypothetical protein